MKSQPFTLLVSCFKFKLCSLPRCGSRVFRTNRNACTADMTAACWFRREGMSAVPMHTHIGSRIFLFFLCDGFVLSFSRLLKTLCRIFKIGKGFRNGLPSRHMEIAAVITYNVASIPVAGFRIFIAHSTFFVFFYLFHFIFHLQHF